MVVRLQIRHDIKSEWELYNPVLASGELGIETDNAEGQRIKIGDGNRAWIDLPFIDDKSVHKYADEEIYGNKIFHNSLLLRQGAEIPEGQILNGLADSASKDDEGNVIKDYYQPKIVVLDEITSETDWNTLIKEGIYKVNIDTWGSASTLHGPNEYIGNIYSKGILCVHANQGFVTHVYYPYMESPIVYRNFNDVEWQTWSSISNLDRTIVHTTGDETIAGNKTFSNNVVLNNGNINFNLVGDALILKGGEPFIKKSTDNDTYLSASEGGSIHFRPNGDTSVEGEVIIDNQGIIQGKVTQDGAGNVISDTYARRDQMEEVANNEGLTAVFLGRNLLDNPSGYTEVKEMYRSTFDRAKFTIEGTPTITKDGIASGFVGQNGSYLRTNYKTENLKNKSWKVKVKFKTGIVTGAETQFTPIINFTNRPKDNYQGFGAISQWTHTLVFAARTGISTDSNNEGAKINLAYILEENKDYSATLEYNHNTGTYILKAYDSNGLLLKEGTWTAPTTQSNTELWGINNATSENYLCIGATREGCPFLGSIDLKYFSINSDGKEIFNGNKTGIDIIKQDNYEIVGSPVISEDGVASGFSGANFVRIPDKYFPSNLSALDISLLINTRNLSTANQAIFVCKQKEDTSKAVLDVRVTTSGGQLVYSAGLGTQKETTFRAQWLGKGKDKIDFKINNSKIELFINEESILTVNDFVYVQPIDFYIGINRNNADIFQGFIDLNSFKIYVDDQLVYQPCLRIPYNKTNAGVKISNINYRDRIEDCYTYYNTANYFIIDEENELYQIPYDVPDGHCVIIAQERNGINLYEYNTNLECTQTGSCTANTEFTFSIPYANDQYALSCPYSAKSRTGFTPTVTGDFISKGLIFLSDTQ